MNRRQLLINGITGVAAIAAAGITPTDAVQAKEKDRNIVGSWLGTITATNPPVGQFNDLISFHRGGVVTESRRYFIPGTPFGNLLETSGHGAWEQREKNVFEAFFRFLLQDADTGAALGTDNIRLMLTLDRQNNILVGTFQSQVKDTSDAILMTFTGDYSAVSITV